MRTTAAIAIVHGVNCNTRVGDDVLVLISTCIKEPFAMTRSARSGTFVPMVPDVPTVKTVLDRSEPLGSLLQRLRASQQCMEAVRPVLPAGLVPHVHPGPLDDEGWTLLAANAAVSSKLRQLQPRLMEALAQKGLKVNAIRLRVQTPG
jgi:hypothetical protein